MSISNGMKFRWSRYLPKIGEDGKPFRPHPKQLAFLMMPFREVLLTGAAGGGKVLYDNSEILTPYGFKKGKELKLNDMVNNPDGSYSRIIQLHPRRSYKVWRVFFNDNTFTDVAEQHLWLAWKSGKGRKVNGRNMFGEEYAEVIETKTLKEWCDSAKEQEKKGIRPNYPLIPVCQEQRFNLYRRSLCALDPYMLGYWLGDGCVTSKSKTITLTTGDNSHLESYLDSLNFQYAKRSDDDYSLVKGTGVRFRRYLKDLGLINTKADSKFIPKEYLYGSIERRWEVLRGLMDTDGTVDDAGHLSFTSISQTLAENVKTLVQSLGGTAVITEKQPFYKDTDGNRVYCNTAYTLYIKHREPWKFFKLPRKVARCKVKPQSMYRRVTDVRVLKVEKMGRCITVSHPNGLYLTNDFIVTHNSMAMIIAAMQYVDIPGYKALLLRRAISDSKLASAIYDKIQTMLNPYVQTGEVKHDRQTHTFTFPSSASLSVSYLRTELDHLRYQCFHPKTEILTKEGWKNVKELKLGELVASLNPETRFMEYQPITKLHKYYYQGDMVEKHGKALAFSVTPNHEVWYSTQKITKLRKSRIDQIPSATKLPQWCNWRGVVPPAKVKFSSNGNNGRSVSFPAKAWAEYLGWYISEGNTHKGKWEIVVTQTKEEGRKQLFELFSKINANVHIDKKRFVINNKALLLWLDEHCGKGAKNKKLPDCVKNWSKKYLRILLKALVSGDGTWRTKTSGVFVSSSKQLAEDVSEIAIKAGYRPTTTAYTMEGFGVKTPGWRVSLLDLSEDTLICNSTTSNNLESQLQRNHYEGDVYCVTVPPNHTVLTRFDGKVVWMGQSTEFHFIGLEELTLFAEDQYTFLFRSLRKLENSPIPLRMWSSTNPTGTGMEWVKRRFRIIWDEDVQEWVGTHPTRKIIQSYARDNPSLSKDYIYSLNELDPITRAQLRDGDWSTGAMSRFKPWYFKDRWITRGKYFSALSSRKSWHRDTCEIFFSVDPAGTQRSMPGGLVFQQNRQPCWSVIGVWARTPDNYLLLLDIVRKQCEIPEMIHWLTKAARVYKPSRIICERNGMGIGVTQIAAMLGLPINPVWTSVDKINNASDAMIRAERQTIILPEDAPWLDDFESEVLNWMGAPNEVDDQVDVLANAAKYVQQQVGGSEIEYINEVDEIPEMMGGWSNGATPGMPQYG